MLTIIFDRFLSSVLFHSFFLFLHRKKEVECIDLLSDDDDEENVASSMIPELVPGSPEWIELADKCFQSTLLDAPRTPKDSKWHFISAHQFYLTTHDCV